MNVGSLYQTIRPNIPKDCDFHLHCCEIVNSLFILNEVPPENMTFKTRTKLIMPCSWFQGKTCESIDTTCKWNQRIYWNPVEDRVTSIRLYRCFPMCGSRNPWGFAIKSQWRRICCVLSFMVRW